MTEWTSSESTGGVQEPGVGKPGSLLKRFGARLIDGILVGVVIGVVFAVIPGLDAQGFLYGLVTGVLSFGYFVFLESSRGATLGKQVLGMRVASGTGASRITPEASAKRNAWMLLGVLSGIPVLGVLAGLASLAIVIAIAVTIGSDARNQGLHDKLAGTMVLDKP